VDKAVSVKQHIKNWLLLWMDMVLYTMNKVYFCIKFMWNMESH